MRYRIDLEGMSHLAFNFSVVRKRLSLNLKSTEWSESGNFIDNTLVQGRNLVSYFSEV